MAIDVEIPADATPGDYSGTIRVEAVDGSFSVDIPVTLTVVPQPEETGAAAEDQAVPPVDPGTQDESQPAPDQPGDHSGDATVTLPTKDDPDDGSGTDTSGDSADPPSGGDSSGGDTPQGDPPSSDPAPSGGDSGLPAAAGSG